MLQLTRRRRLGVALLPLVLAGGVLTACGGESSSSSGEGGSGGGMTVKSGVFTWSAAKLTNAILTETATRNPGLGVKEITSTQLGPAPAWAGAQRGDIDLLGEVALPNQQELADKAKSRMNLVKETYGNAEQGWYVPSYAVAPGGPLAGLTSISQLNQFKSQLGGKLVDSDPTFVTTKQNKKRLEGYKVDFQQVTSSEAAQLAELRRAYSRQEPILVYLYHPSWVFSEFDMVKLEEPAPYTEGCLEDTGNGACAMPAYSAWTAGSKELQKNAPKFYAMLEKFQLPLADVEEMLKAVDVDNQPVEQVAKQWMDTHQAEVQKWLS